DQDRTLAGFDPIAPLGTHHTVLAVNPNPTQPDGITTCGGLVVEPHIIFGAGVGTQRLDMPAGGGVRLHKGTQLLMNLHIYNTSDQPLTGTSGVMIKEVPSDTLQVEAEAVLMGPISFSIPMGVQSVDGQCTLLNDSTLFAVGPHMHKLGIHMTAQAGDTMLMD